MSEADPLLVESVQQLLADISPPEVVERAEAFGWSSSIWGAMAGAGYPWVGIDEAAGGSGGSPHDIAAIVTECGRSAAPVPLAETAMVGGWLLAKAGLELPIGPVTAVAAPGQLDGKRLRVDAGAAWARHADRCVVTVGSTVCALRPDQVRIAHGANLAGEARDRVWADIDLGTVSHATVDDIDPWGAALVRGALSRVLMAAGAMSRVAQMTFDYTHERRQFGHAVATFQAVQAHLVVVAQSALRLQMAADSLIPVVASGNGRFEVAAARVVMHDAITAGTRAAHQAHGAMGVTREYPLHLLTRRLWSWCHEWGSPREWRRAVGMAALSAGADDLFDLVSGVTSTVR